MTYLLTALQSAVPATLVRVGRGGTGLAVRVDQNDPNAVPIAPEFLRRSAQGMAEQWYADINTANGRLDAGFLDLPPIETIRVAFGRGLADAGLPMGGADFGPHESWPFIVASAVTRGTPGPYWFLIRRTNNLDQLAARLRQVKDIGSRSMGALDECLAGIEAIQSARPVAAADPVFGDVLRDIERADSEWDRVAARLERGGLTYPLPPTTADQLQALLSSGGNLAASLIEIASSNQSAESRRYWCRVLAEVSNSADDAFALVTILQRPELEAAHAAAKKAIRRIDFATHGPPLARS